MFEFLTDNGVIAGSNCSLIFDGMQVLDTPYNRGRLTPDFLKDLSKHIKTQIGISLNIKIKDFNEGFNIDLDAVKTQQSNKLKSYEETKLLFDEISFKIRHPPMVVSKKEKGFEYQPFKAFRESYRDIQYLGIDSTGNPCEKSFVFDWEADRNIRCYDYITFKPPPLQVKNDSYNTWEPFEITKEPLIKTERDYWAEFKLYAKNLFNNEQVVNFILARYAFRLQKPGIRTYVCLIICGTEGDGKNRFLEPIYRIFGRKYICYYVIMI